MTTPAPPATPAPSLLGGSITLPANVCRHGRMRHVSPWTGEPGTVGTAAVIGAGKMGLPLAAQFAGHGWTVIAVDIDPTVVDAINAGQSHVGEEPGLAELVAEAHAAGRLRATLDGAAAAREADVVVLIVPVMLDDESRPDHRIMDSAVEAIIPGVHAGSLVIFETTLPVGDTRGRFAPRLAEATGLVLEEDLLVAFSPERLYSGSALRNLATYPKLVGGLGEASTARAVAFYESVLDARVEGMSSAEAAEFAKLADTTYRDVNIALANEFSRYADRIGVDITEIIAAANSQPYSHIHQPGLGVGGHCIPVYPHFLLDRAPELELVALSRRVNDGQVGQAIRTLQLALGGLDGAEVLVLGLTYRDGVKELAYSRALPLIERLGFHGAHVLAYDPLLVDEEIVRTGAAPWRWGRSAPAVRAVITQTADPAWAQLDPAWFPQLELFLDGRNSLRDLALPPDVAYQGIGQRRGR
jgi:nucleotide sugar dehydrogenase